MSCIERRAISSINYIFLRASTGLEIYPESITEELGFFLSGLANDLGNTTRSLYLIPISVLKGYVKEELSEGTYLPLHMQEFSEKIRSFCYENTDLSEEEIDIVCNFYESVANEVYAERQEQEKE